METETTTLRRAARASASPPDATAPGVDADVTAISTTSDAPAVTPRPRARRGASRGHPRESGVTGLAERARLASSGFATPLLDPLFSALPAMRHALLNRALDDALRVAGAQLGASLAPSVVQFWIADPGVWGGETDRVGGLELFPTLRARVTVTAARAQGAGGQGEPQGGPGGALPPGVIITREAIATDPLIEEVASARRAIILNDADAHALARAWLPRLGDVSGQGRRVRW